MRTWIPAAVAVLVLAGCHRPAAADAGTDAGAPAPVDAGPPPPPPLTVTVQESIADGGTQTITLVPGERPELDPTQDLSIQVNRGLKNARIRVLDEADRVLQSDEKLDEEPSSIRDDVHLVDPLIPGHKYTVVIDAQTGASVLDEAGQPVPDQRLGFSASGEPPPPQPKKPARRTRHRRHRRH